MKTRRMSFRWTSYGLAAVLALCAGLLFACTPAANRPGDTETPTPADSDCLTLPAEPGSDGETLSPGETVSPGETEPSADAGCDPVFSLPGGRLREAATLSLSLPASAPAGAYVTYTTDGSEPVPRQEGDPSAIPVLGGTDCTVIRAAVFDEDGYQLGHTVTVTYLRADASTLRAVSLVTDPEHLWGTSGLFVDRTATGRAGEHPVSVEILEPDGTVLLRQDAAVRLAGAGSRTFDPANLRIIARKPAALSADEAYKYSGQGKFHAALFADSDDESCDSFLLRCGGNDSLHQARSDFLRMNTLRDAITNNLCANAEALLGGTVFAQRATPVAVYLNGSYYGLLHMKEDFDENLIEARYGLPEAGIALLKGKKDGKSMYYNIEAGDETDLADWQDLCAFAVAHATAADYEEAYIRVAEQLDVESFSRYYAVMLYLCNTDWPQNNTMIWRYTPTAGDGTAGKPYADGKWRAVIRDMDLCFGLHDKVSQTSSTTYSMADTDTFYRITVFYRDGGYRYDPALGLYDDTMGFQGLFDFLMRSEAFRRLFREDCAALTSEEFAALARTEIERYYALATPELPAHLVLWQGKGEIHPDYTARHFRAAKRDMLAFAEDRPAYFNRYLEEALSYYE